MEDASERLRRDPVTGKLAVIAPERRRRPALRRRTLRAPAASRPAPSAPATRR